MRRAIASTVVRGLQAGGPSSSSSGVAVRALSTQAPITATLFPGDGEAILSLGTRMQRRRCWLTTRRRRRQPGLRGGRAAALPLQGSQSGRVGGLHRA